jgi:hypothetical protein
LLVLAVGFLAVPTALAAPCLSTRGIRTCMVLSGGRASCIGDNADGLLAIDTTASLGTKAGDADAAIANPIAFRDDGAIVTGLSLGTDHACALFRKEGCVS